MAVGLDPETGEVVYIPASTQMAALQGAGQGFMESAPVRGLGRILGGAAHALTAPLRGVSAVAHNIADVGPDIDVSDAMLYGRDMNTGMAATPYGTALRRVIAGEEQAGDAPTGYWADKALDVVETAGNVISDPMALAAGISAASRLGAGAGGTSPTAARQVQSLSRQGAAKAAPKPKIKYTGEVLDTDLAPAGAQNRTYSFPNRMREWSRSTSPNRLKEVPPGQHRQAAAELDTSPSADINRLDQLLKTNSRTARQMEGEAREAMIREGFMDPAEGAPSTLLDTDLVRGNPATSRLRAGELADYLTRQEARRGPGTGAGPGAAGAGEELAPGSGSYSPYGNNRAQFGVPAEEAGALTTANQMFQSMLAMPENARRALMEALGDFVG